MNKNELKLQLIAFLNNLQAIGYEVIEENDFDSLEELISAVVLPVCVEALEEGTYLPTIESPIGKVQTDQVLFEIDDETYAPIFSGEKQNEHED